MAGKPKPKVNQLAQRQLRPADRERYNAPDWIDVEKGVDALNDLDYEGLKSIEDQIQAEYGMTLMRYIGNQFPTLSLESERVRCWLGLLAAGADIKLADFKPATFNLDTRPRPADADPPATTSESSPASTETTTPESETSTSGSTPGSPSTTA